jgi:hypothetical protein
MIEVEAWVVYWTPEGMRTARPTASSTSYKVVRLLEQAYATGHRRGTEQAMDAAAFEFERHCT